MEKNKNDIPSHIRINHDKFIHHRIENAKKIIMLEQRRTKITDREALRFLLDLTNNGNGAEVTHQQLKIFKETCCMWNPLMKKFPYEQLGQLICQLNDGVIKGDEIKQGFMSIIAKSTANFNIKKEDKKK